MPSLNAPCATHASTPHPQSMANCLRVLAMDAVEKANSGHPGMPMGMADVAYVLFSQFLKFDPAYPQWPDRDRFVLSAGHGSMLLYGLNYLTGYSGMALEHLKNFRQWASPTAGHPEHQVALGIETTTGPLGQGLANAVGMALAEKMLKSQFGPHLVDHTTYAIVGDGCLSEGISQEALSFAGHLGLDNLIVLWDDNQITIDGPTSLSTSDNHLQRFEASGWFVQSIDGHDVVQIADALRAAQRSTRPAFIACRTVIGFGSPTKSGTAACHGSPLGATEVAQARAHLNWDCQTPFEIPPTLLEAWRAIGARGQVKAQAWQERLNQAAPGIREAFSQRMSRDLGAPWQEALQAQVAAQVPGASAEATRVLSQQVIEIIAPHLPGLVGGSADLTPSNNTRTSTMRAIVPGDFAGTYIHYGVREHGMAAVMNGLALHGGFTPYGGTFLAFADYARPAMRLSALMKQRVIYVMTHDSIGLGEDGPTHQPIEHLSSLRAIPHMHVFRPADLIETAESWTLALSGVDGPSVLALSRQKIPPVRHDNAQNLTAQGGYVLRRAGETPQVTLIASGSEVHLALDVAVQLKEQGIAAAVVSMPCQALFDAQPVSYQRETLGTGLRVAIEAAHPMSWYKYVGCDGLVFGMESFGACAPYPEVYHRFGLEPRAITQRIIQKLKKQENQK